MLTVDGLGPKQSDRYQGVVDLWRWSVREVLLYHKPSLNRPSYGSILNSPLREVVGLGSYNMLTVD